jgi:hypothetical protein
LRLTLGRNLKPHTQVLYSEIGDTFYADCRQGEGEASLVGWVRQKPPTRVWTVPNAVVSVKEDGWEWLDRDGVRRVEKEAVREVEEGIAKIGDDKRTRLAVLPEEWVGSFVPTLEPHRSPTPTVTEAYSTYIAYETYFHHGQYPDSLHAHMVSSFRPPHPPSAAHSSPTASRSTTTPRSTPST